MNVLNKEAEIKNQQKKVDDEDEDWDDIDQDIDMDTDRPMLQMENKKSEIMM